ncbi:MAG: dihydrofolate reductase family protein [Candidatus Jacksonbacteria bacterium]
MKTVLIAAVTLDGKIAKSAYHNVNWTSKEDKQFFRKETRKAGAVIFGSNTYKAIGKPMPRCLNIIMTRQPQKYQSQTQKGLLEFTTDSPSVILDKLTKRGFKKAIIGGGSAIYSLFLQANLIEEIYLTVAPKIFGKGISLFQDVEIDEVNWRLIDVGKLGEGEVLMKYKLKI